MSDTYIVNNSDLTAVADAIRTKTGSADQLTFPAGFTTAINSIKNAPEVYTEEIYNEDGYLTSAVVHGCTKIRQSVFRYSSYLTKVTIPDNVTRIAPQVFDHCDQLTTVNLPDTITVIDNNAFQGCLAFNTEKLPDGLTELGSMVFYGCRSLTLANLPTGVKIIGSEAFSNCTGLTTLTFQGTPTNIAASAFEGCTNLTTINVPWAEDAVANAPWGATNATINYNYTAT